MIFAKQRRNNSFIIQRVIIKKFNTCEMAPIFKDDDDTEDYLKLHANFVDDSNSQSFGSSSFLHTNDQCFHQIE